MAVLDVDTVIFDPDDPEQATWFHAILHGDELTVHSLEIGDFIGSLKVDTAYQIVDSEEE